MQLKTILTSALGAGILGLGLGLGQAQTANYAGPVTGGEWNTAANWDVLVPPGAGTNAVILVGTNVNYSQAMTAATFGTLTNQGILNVSAAGFNDTGIVMTMTNGRLFLNNGGVVNVTGVMGLSSNAACSMAPGSSLTVSGTLYIGSDTSGANGGAATISDIGSFTNNGGALTVGGVNLNPRNQSVNQSCRLVINGGTNILGNYVANRSPGGASAPPTLGTDGLVISNGFVNTTSITIGNNAHGVMYQVGGTVTNSGTLILKNTTATRPARFIQVGGLFVDPDPSIVNLQGTADAAYSVLGGTNIIGGILFGAATSFFTNAATMYIGSQGMVVTSTVTSMNAALNNGGLFGATASWTGQAAMKLNGGIFTFQTADAAGNPFNITLTNVLSGTGGLNQNGGGLLTLGAVNTYSGNTILNGSGLVLAAGGSLASPRIVVGSGSTFDVSQLTGFTLSGSQTLSGFGTVTGAVTAATSATIFPGSNAVTGTLSFKNGLTENGGVVNQLNLASNPTGPGNDLISVQGGLTLSGINTVAISGSLATGSAYPVFKYDTLTGGTANLAVVGPSGIFSNSASSQTIYFIPQSSIRNATNIVWIGNPTANNWDTENTTNWLNTGTAALDFFVPGDTALFNNVGATNPLVNIPGTVTPALTIFNTISNYTLLGTGGIGGAGSLTVSNGTVNILTTNTYTGATVIDGGVLSTPLIANSVNPSGIGAGSSDPSLFVVNGGTFGYTGPSAGTDHGITLGNSGGTFDVTNGSTLTLNGSIGGNGGLTLVDTGTLTLTAANAYGGNTTISNGTLNLNNAVGASAGAINLAGGTLDFTVGSQPTFLNNFNVMANSTIISAGGNNNIITGTVLGNNNVTLNVVIGGTGTFSVGGNGGSGDMTNFFGTVELGNSTGTFRFNSAGGNVQFGAQNATIDLGTNSAILQARNAGTMLVGALEGGTNTFLKGQGSGTGTLVWQIGSSPNNPSTTFFGTIAPGAAANDICSITKIGTGTLSLAGQSTYTGTTTVSNGTVALINNPLTGLDGSINGSATINVLAGAILSGTGRNDGAVPVGATGNQVLEGNGNIQGILTLGGSGVISPGGGPTGSIGTLTASSINLAAGGTTLMKLNRNGSQKADKLVSLGAFNAGGTLQVTNIGAALQVNDSFTLFSSGSAPTGGFNLVLPGFYTWDTSQLMVNGTIKVTAVFSPAISSIDTSDLIDGNIGLTATNGQPDAVISVLTSTNLLLPLSSWTFNTQFQLGDDGNLTGARIHPGGSDATAVVHHPEGELS